MGEGRDRIQWGEYSFLHSFSEMSSPRVISLGNRLWAVISPEGWSPNKKRISALIILFFFHFFWCLYCVRVCVCMFVCVGAHMYEYVLTRKSMCVKAQG